MCEELCHDINCIDNIEKALGGIVDKNHYYSLNKSNVNDFHGDPGEDML